MPNILDRILLPSAAFYGCGHLSLDQGMKQRTWKYSTLSWKTGTGSIGRLPDLLPSCPLACSATRKASSSKAREHKWKHWACLSCSSGSRSTIPMSPFNAKSWYTWSSMCNWKELWTTTKTIYFWDLQLQFDIAKLKNITPQLAFCSKIKKPKFWNTLYHLRTWRSQTIQICDFRNGTLAPFFSTALPRWGCGQGLMAGH